jgi:OPT family oligopeptide transporter
MLYPINLPMNSLLEALHGDKVLAKKQLKVFYIGFVVLFFWEIIPEWIMPILVGVSVLCFANKNSLVFTNFFGGSNGNEGMGIFGISFDWQYIANPSPLWYPFQTLFNSFVGYVLCICVFAGIYYGNIWRSRDFPFLSQVMFSQDSNSTSYVQYNQTAVLDPDTWAVDWDAVQTIGFPFFTGTFAIYLLASNLSITSTFTHLLLWNWNDLKASWAFMTPSAIAYGLNPANWNFRFWKTDESKWGGEGDKETDPHYRLLLVHKDSPNWWYFMVLLLSIAIGLATTYSADSTLPWWGFLVSCIISSICILFFGAQYAITGYQFNMQSVIQIIGGYMQPGRPMANMYFVMFGYNSVVQAQLLLKDLKFAQYAHLSPRCTFTMQMVRVFYVRIL